MNLPKIELNATGIAAILALGLVAYAVYKSSDTVKTVINSVNPFSDKNLAYQSANGLVQFGTGQQDETLGGFVHDWFNPSEYTTNNSTGFLSSNFDDSLLGAAMHALGLNSYPSDTANVPAVKPAPTNATISKNVYRLRTTAEVRAGLSATDSSLITGTRKAYA